MFQSRSSSSPEVAICFPTLWEVVLQSQIPGAIRLRFQRPKRPFSRINVFPSMKTGKRRILLSSGSEKLSRVGLNNFGQNQVYPYYLNPSKDKLWDKAAITSSQFKK